MEEGFTHLLRVRYSECDAQKVVFNAKYIEYIDVAVTEYMRSLFGGYNRLLEMGLDNQVVALHVDWKASARFDDVIAIGIRTQAIGNTSFQLKLTFVNNQSKETIATADITYVMVSTDTYQKTPVPAQLRALLNSGGAGVISNHAGT